MKIILLNIFNNEIILDENFQDYVIWQIIIDAIVIIWKLLWNWNRMDKVAKYVCMKYVATSYSLSELK